MNDITAAEFKLAVDIEGFHAFHLMGKIVELGMLANIFMLQLGGF